MLLYEFQCNACKAIFEELCGDDETPECPKCHSRDAAERLIGARVRTKPPMVGFDERVLQSIETPPPGYQPR